MAITCKEGQNKYYPAANRWMWNYCTYLGSVEYNGNQYDLGVWICPDGHPSAAIVCSNQEGNYMSGSLANMELLNELYTETRIRFNIYKENNCEETKAKEGK